MKATATVQCVHCRRMRPADAMVLARLPGLPMMCKRGFACYLAGVKARFRDPWHWRRKMSLPPPSASCSRVITSSPAGPRGR
jgi:hypothetical protein